jgi:hypothetical protein
MQALSSVRICKIPNLVELECSPLNLHPIADLKVVKALVDTKVVVKALVGTGVVVNFVEEVSVASLFVVAKLAGFLPDFIRLR